jgi:DNA-binding XRE family transcriptional regulator
MPQLSSLILRSLDGSGHRAVDIAKRIGARPNSVNRTLHRLYAQRLVERADGLWRSAVPAPTDMTADELRAIRHSLGLTQAEFGAAIGLAKNTIACLEIGRRRITARTAAQVRGLLASGTVVFR